MLFTALPLLNDEQVSRGRLFNAKSKKFNVFWLLSKADPRQHPFLAQTRSKPSKTIGSKTSNANINKIEYLAIEVAQG